MAAHSSPFTRSHHHHSRHHHHAKPLSPIADFFTKNKHFAQAQQLINRLILKAQDLGAGMPLQELMLISVPGDPTPEKSLDKVQRKTKGMANMFNFRIPKFKVGTLDQLVALSEQLNKMDTDAETTVHKITTCLPEVTGAPKEKLVTEMQANGKSPMIYVTSFEWDRSRFPLNLSVKHLSEMMMKQYERIESELDKRMVEYRSALKRRDEMTKDTTTNLARRSLNRIVKDEHMVQSDNLMTALVVVPKARIREWTNTYESFGSFVVPRSSHPIYSDDTHSLFGVTIFKKFQEEFKQKVLTHHFVYRPFEIVDDQTEEKQQQEIVSSRKKIDELKGPLVQWLRINFGEAFICWMHLKVLRLFVESVLRYGLPINFAAALLEPTKKTAASRKALLNAIDSVFADTQETLARQKLTAKEMAEYPQLKDMIFDSTLEHSFILFLFTIDVPDAPPVQKATFERRGLFKFRSPAQRDL